MDEYSFYLIEGWARPISILYNNLPQQILDRFIIYVGIGYKLLLYAVIRKEKGLISARTLSIEDRVLLDSVGVTEEDVNRRRASFIDLPAEGRIYLQNANILS